MTDDFKTQLEHLAERLRKIEDGYTPGLRSQIEKLEAEVVRLREKSAVDFERYNNISKCIERMETDFNNKLTGFKVDVSSRFEKLDKDLSDGLGKIDSRFKEISRNVTWFVRTVLGLIITTIGIFAFAGGFKLP